MIYANTETFVWDGLALIDRNGTSYINEPHAGDGNPVLTISGGNGTHAIFNDMLGTSVGTVSSSGYSPITKTTFGYNETNNTATADTNFYTGKPNVRNLGYVFLMRNYRSDLGKWQTEDPTGYPDGWNNFAYCNNMVTSAIDLYGCAVYWAARDLESSPLGNHHFFVFIPDNPSDFSGMVSNFGTSNNTVLAFTIGAFETDVDGTSLLVVEKSNDTDDWSLLEVYNPDATWPLVSDFDLQMNKIASVNGLTDTDFINLILEIIDRYDNECPYHLLSTNCAAFVNTVLSIAGVSASDRKTYSNFWGIDAGTTTLIPLKHFE